MGGLAHKIFLHRLGDPQLQRQTFLKRQVFGPFLFENPHGKILVGLTDLEHASRGPFRNLITHDP